MCPISLPDIFILRRVVRGQIMSFACPTHRHLQHAVPGRMIVARSLKHARHRELVPVWLGNHLAGLAVSISATPDLGGQAPRRLVQVPKNGFKTNSKRKRGRFHAGFPDALAGVSGSFLLLKPLLKIANQPIERHVSRYFLRSCFGDRIVFLLRRENECVTFVDCWLRLS